MTLDFEFDNSEWVDMGAGSASLQNVNGATLTCWLNVESLSGPTEQYYLYLSESPSLNTAEAVGGSTPMQCPLSTRFQDLRRAR
jgi:hypothetical protein